VTHLLLWLLLFPLVAAGDLYIRAQVSTVSPGRLSKGHAATYLIGAFVFLSLTIAQHV